MFSFRYKSCPADRRVYPLLIALAIAAGLAALRLAANGGSLTRTFTATSYATGQATAGSLAVGDYNNDGATDVVATAGSRVVTMKGQLESGLPETGH